MEMIFWKRFVHAIILTSVVWFVICSQVWKMDISKRSWGVAITRLGFNGLEASRNLSHRLALKASRNLSHRLVLKSSRNLSHRLALKASRNLSHRLALKSSRNLSHRLALKASRNLSHRLALKASRNLSHRLALKSSRNLSHRLALKASRNLSHRLALKSSRNLSHRLALKASRNSINRLTSGGNMSYSTRSPSNISDKPHSILRDRRSIKCHFPELKPFDSRVMPFVEYLTPIYCDNNTPRLVDVVDDELRVDPSKVKAKIISKAIDYCRYRTISRIPHDDMEIQYGDWSPRFNTSIRLGDSEEFLQVECYHKGILLSRSYASMVRKKEAVEKMRLDDYRKHVALHAPKETMNVLLVGIDGMSRENVIRTMRQTRGYLLKEMKAIEFKQYNKVGLNTFPNVIPLLTGLHVKELKKQGWNRVLPFDVVADLFLWNLFQRAGYRTAVQMDDVNITAFNNENQGWRKPPSDYYPRPLNIASESDKVYRRRSIHCMGDIPEVTYMLDYYVRLMTLFNSSTASIPYFLYSFFTRLTHISQGHASKGDESYLHFLQRLVQEGLLGNTVLILFSDHGARFGKVRNTFNGLFEANHPMLYFVFPPWFEKKYPQVMSNFRNNADRLVTAFDVHETLRDLLTLTGTPRRYRTTARGISLFSEIPPNRTCATAGVAVEFCGCVSFSLADDTSAVVKRYLAGNMLRQINKETDGVRGKCAFLRLDSVIRVHRATGGVGDTVTGSFLYNALVRTSPGDGVFEAWLWYDPGNHHVDVVGEISRNNLYQGQAECVHTSHLRSFCFCRKRPP